MLTSPTDEFIVCSVTTTEIFAPAWTENVPKVDWSKKLGRVPPPVVASTSTLGILKVLALNVAKGDSPKAFKVSCVEVLFVIDNSIPVIGTPTSISSSPIDDVNWDPVTDTWTEVPPTAPALVNVAWIPVTSTLAFPTLDSSPVEKVREIPVAKATTSFGSVEKAASENADTPRAID